MQEGRTASQPVQVRMWAAPPGVSAGLGASVGGSSGVNAGGGASIGGSNGVDVGVGVGIGGGTSGGGGVIGGGGTGGGEIGGGAANPSRPGGVRNPPTTGGLSRNRPGNPPQAERLRAEIRNMSQDERLRLRRSCAMVSASPESYDADMQALCRLMSRMSAL